MKSEPNLTPLIRCLNKIHITNTNHSMSASNWPHYWLIKPISETINPKMWNYWQVFFHLVLQNHALMNSFFDEFIWLGPYIKMLNGSDCQKIDSNSCDTYSVHIMKHSTVFLYTIRSKLKCFQIEIPQIYCVCFNLRSTNLVKIMLTI